MPDRRFSEQEAQEILKRVVERDSTRSDGVIREDLIQAVSELGIDPSIVDAAIADMELDREVEHEVSRVRAKRGKRLMSHFLAWLSVSLVLTSANWGMNGPDVLYWVVAIWSIGVLLHAQRVWLRHRDEDREVIQRKLAKKRKAERAQRTRTNRPPLSTRLEDIVERSIEQGVDGLVRAIARRIGEATGNPPRSGPTSHHERRRVRVDREREDAHDVSTGAASQRSRRA